MAAGGFMKPHACESFSLASGPFATLGRVPQRTDSGRETLAT